MADIFDVVADATRRDLMQILLERYVSGQAEAGEISVGDLVEHLGLSQPTVSKHLKVLRDHGLVTVREDGQHRYYRMDAAPLESIEDWVIPFLSADFDGAADDAGSVVFAAWAGADVGDTIGRRIAEGSHQARTVIHEATERLHDVSGAVVGKLPEGVRHRLFGEH